MFLLQFLLRFVDVVHTDTLPLTRGGLGMPDPIGHVDFYPNGGHTNPGCDKPMQHYILSTGKFKPFRSICVIACKKKIVNIKNDSFSSQQAV